MSAREERLAKIEEDLREIQRLQAEEQEEKKQQRYAGRGSTRTAEDLPSERHWKRAMPKEQVDHDD
jgi:hypothetical protein